MAHIYNWKRDKIDIRDFKYCEVHKQTIEKLPESVDLRPLCGPVFDQGDIGSCTAQSLAGALELLQLKYLKDTTVKAAEEFSEKYDALSRLFIYYNERELEGTPDEDSGAQIRDGIKVLAAKGVCRESLWEYKKENLILKPNKKAYTEAKDHKITVYSRLDNLNDLKNCLASGFPFVFGFMVYDSFESEDVAKTGKMILPKKNERVLGGHAVMGVGYDDKSQNMIIRNSWGPGWGDKGYFYMPYNFISDNSQASDFWTIRI